MPVVNIPVDEFEICNHLDNVQYLYEDQTAFPAEREHHEEEQHTRAGQLDVPFGLYYALKG